MHGMQAHLCCSGQNPVEDAVYVGFDVLGILTSGDDRNATLHVPLQAHLRDQRCILLVAYPAGAPHCSYCPPTRRRRREEEEIKKNKKEGKDKDKKRNKRQQIYDFQQSWREHIEAAALGALAVHSWLDTSYAKSGC